MTLHYRYWICDRGPVPGFDGPSGPAHAFCVGSRRPYVQLEHDLIAHPCEAGLELEICAGTGRIIPHSNENGVNYSLEIDLGEAIAA